MKLRPFDIEGRNKFYQQHDYFGREFTLNQEIGWMYRAGQLPSEEKLLFEGLLVSAAALDSCGAERPEVINSSACDTAIGKKHDYAFKGVGKIIDLTPPLKEFKPFWALADDFWARRNDAMINDIGRHPRGDPGQGCSSLMWVRAQVLPLEGALRASVRRGVHPKRVLGLLTPRPAPRLTTARTRPRISVPFIVNLCGF